MKHTMQAWLPTLFIILATFLIVVSTRAFLKFRAGPTGSQSLQFRIQAWTVGLIFLGLLALILVLPESIDSNLLFSVIGLVVTGALAISGQSIIANGMAGIMLRIIANFRPGDFIEVSDHTGRVSEMGLFHTEIQSPDRDLITLPNALMVNKPVRVVRSSGTITSVQIGLGYDISRHKLKPLFNAAAEHAGLEDPFVQVVELGDYAITYRVAGFLAEYTRVLAARSHLREELLDGLSEAGIEIMSPMVVARRAIDAKPLIPRRVKNKKQDVEEPTAETKAFDKAEQAAELDDLRRQVDECHNSITELKTNREKQDEAEQLATDKGIESAQQKIERLNQQIALAEDEKVGADELV